MSQTHRLINGPAASRPIYMKTSQDRDRIRIAWQEPTMMQIGKAGVTDSVIEEAKRLLKKHRYIKIRILRSAIGESDKLHLIRLLCRQAGASFAGMRGNTAVIYKTRLRAAPDEL